MDAEVKALTMEYYKIMIARPLPRIFWRLALRKAMKMAYHMVAVTK